MKRLTTFLAVCAVLLTCISPAASAREGYVILLSGGQYDGEIKRCNGSNSVTLWSNDKMQYETHALKDIYKIVIFYKSYRELDLCPDNTDQQCIDYWMWSNKEPGRIAVVKKNEDGGEGEKIMYEFVKGDGCFEEITARYTENFGDIDLKLRIYVSSAIYIKDREHYEWNKNKMAREIYFVPPPKPEPLADETGFIPQLPGGVGGVGLPQPLAPLPDEDAGGQEGQEKTEAADDEQAKPKQEMTPDMPIDLMFEWEE